LIAWENPESPGRTPAAIDGGGTAAQISAENIAGRSPLMTSKRTTPSKVR
jgi:hypothetical protein